MTDSEQTRIGAVVTECSTSAPCRACLLLLMLLTFSRLTAAAEELSVPANSTSQSSDVEASLPEDLPRYALEIDLHPQKRRVSVHQNVTWTNTGTAPTNELVFQVVPNHKLSKEMISLGARTAESLRLNPRYSIDEQGRRFHMTEATIDGQSVKCRFSRQHDTHLHFPLHRDVDPGESVTVSMRYLRPAQPKRRLKHRSDWSSSSTPKDACS